MVEGGKETMTDVREAIVQDIIDALATISENNGFNLTLALPPQRKQIKLRQFPQSNCPAVFVGDPRVTVEPRTQDYFGYTMELIVRGVVKSADFESDIHYLAKDIENAIMTDIHRGLDEVGYTEIIDVDGFAENGVGTVDVTLNVYWTEVLP
jgi:hypothetical protein